ncbi:outer membrane beta-barrel protein [Spongiibacter marinus]|uniref:outer membrane beta-barrel protein n=1 Tax=Spongiibacter marinus TaxID=354246 RepID=UPI003564C833
MKRITSTLMVPAGFLALAVSTPLMAKEFSYSYAELGVADIEVDDRDGDYLYGGGSLALDRNVFIRASVGNLDFDPGEADVVSLGVGHPMRISERSDLVLALDYSYTDPDRGDNDIDTLAASVQSRTWLTNNIEGNLSAGYAHADYDKGDDSGAMLGAGVRLYVTPLVSVAAELNRSFVGDLDTDSFGISGRVQF